ncbi:DUF6442 family protein [Lacticaseibacillus absianus]|uniref:DUF6442 family protein n=1 Tax=Lacticaseibacillus absianus TaxID=2729623 RepID=UPI0015C6C83E|nr:DUF6442 family protein [Lacticaseibacillus absianus]
MKRDEILAKSRRDNLLWDEQERAVRAAAASGGHLVLGGLLLGVLVISMIQQWQGRAPLVAPWLIVAILSWDEFVQVAYRQRHGSHRLGWGRLECWGAGLAAVAASLLYVLELVAPG